MNCCRAILISTVALQLVRLRFDHPVCHVASSLSFIQCVDRAVLQAVYNCYEKFMLVIVFMFILIFMVIQLLVSLSISSVYDDFLYSKVNDEIIRCSSHTIHGR